MYTALLASWFFHNLLKLFTRLFALLTDDDGNGYTTHHSYSGSADVGKTADEGIWYSRHLTDCNVLSFTCRIQLYFLI
jgi:hypothetical protein